MTKLTLIAFAVVLLGCAVMLVAKKMEGILGDACEFIAHPENSVFVVRDDDHSTGLFGAHDDDALATLLHEFLRAPTGDDPDRAAGAWHVIYDRPDLPREVTITPVNADTAAELVAADEIEALHAALRKIAKAEGVYNRDPLEHAENIIKNMIAIAEKELDR
jgi:hypothetical protein